MEHETTTESTVRDGQVRFAIYGRVSTSDGRQHVLNQLVQLRAFAASQNWQVESEYVDYKSGKNSDRAEFRRLFDQAARRQFDVVLFWALDRFTREVPVRL